MKLRNCMSIVLLAYGPLAMNASGDTARDHHADHHHGHEHNHNHNHNQGQDQKESWHNRAKSADIGPLGEQLYTCSMHPQVRSLNPDDRCPICGMALIPVPQDDQVDDTDGREAVTLTLGARALALTGVRTQPVQKRRAELTLRLPGRIEVNERSRHSVSARFSGRVEKLYINTSGAPVQLGDPVADIYSPELMAAQEELLQAKRLRAQGTRGEQGYAAARDKLRLLGLAPELMDAIEAEGRVREVVPIVATGQGLVQSLNIVEGQYLQTGDNLFQLVDITSIWAILEAYESDLSLLEVDQAVTLHNATRPDISIEGRIEFIEPWVDSVKRTAAVRVVLDNLDQQLKPGMLVRAQVHAEQAPALLIPASAPLLTGARALVYLQDPERLGRFTAREVILGSRMGDYYSVASGLSEGEVVVTHGALRIDSELQIRGRPSMMAPAGGDAPAHDHDHSQHQHPDPSPAQVTADAPSEPVDPELARALPLFHAYDLAQQALADDRLEDWRQAARDLQTHAEAVTWPEVLDSIRTQMATGQGALDEVEDLSAAGKIFYHHAQGMLRCGDIQPAVEGHLYE